MAQQDPTPRLTLREAMARQSTASPPPERSHAKVDVPKLVDSLATAERQAIIYALVANQHYREQTAKALGISRVSLFQKMRRYGLIPFPEELRRQEASGRFSLLEQHVEAYERQLLLDALAAAAGNRSEAAKRLGMGRNRFYQKLWDHGIIHRDSEHGRTQQ